MVILVLILGMSECLLINKYSKKSVIEWTQAIRKNVNLIQVHVEEY